MAETSKANSDEPSATTPTMVSVRPKVRVIKAAESEELVGEPVDKRTVKVVDADGNQQSVAALHQRFSECLVYVKYTSPPKNANLNNERHNKQFQEWVEMVLTLELNLGTLLRLPYHRFWSTVIHEKDFHSMLDSYLLNAPRFFDFNQLLITDQMKESINEVHKLILRVYSRMSNFIESKKDHMTPAVFGSLIYDHNVFDIRKLMQICLLYADFDEQSNGTVKKICENVFKHNKKYIDDLQSSIATVISVLRRIQQNTGLSTNNDEVPINTFISSRMKNMKWCDLQETIYFVTELAVTLSSFASIYSNAATLYHKHRLETTLINFYENVFPLLNVELESRFNEDMVLKSIAEDVKKQVTLCRHYFIKLFRDILVTCCFNPLFDQSVDNNSKCLIIDDYLDLITIALSERCFSTDYFAKYPFVEDLSALMEKSELTGFNNVDQTRIDYLLNTACNRDSLSESKTVNKSKTKEIETNKIWNRNENIEQHTSRESIAKTPRQNVEAVTSADVLKWSKFQKEPEVNNKVMDDEKTVDEATLESYITSITDIFPDYGHGFIEVCLQHYDYDSEKVVDALLNESLPESIGKLDRRLQRKAKKPNCDNYRISAWKVNQMTSLESPRMESKTDTKTVPSHADLDWMQWDNKDLNKQETKKTIEKMYGINRETEEERKYEKKEVNVEEKLDEKMKTIMKLSAIRLQEEYSMANEYNDEYDDTFDTAEPQFVVGEKESGQTLGYRRNRK